jgi:EpsI family protein
LPDEVGDFVGRDEPLDKRLVRGAEAATMINRVYRNRVGDAVIVNLGVWTQYKKVIPHAPEICYTMAGWEIASRRDMEVPTGSGKKARIKQFIFQNGTKRIAVAFWVHLDDEIFAEGENVRRARQRLRGTGDKLPPLIKVMLQTDAADVEQAQTRLSRFATSLLPYSESIH